MSVRVGVSVRDVTPPAGAVMSGFVARTRPATGAHDPLLVQALVVEDTAVVTVDVVGLHEDDCAEVRRRCPLPDRGVVVHATHTHGGPASMRGRLGGPVDEGWLDRVVTACVDAVTEAAERREPVEVAAGYGPPPGVARNRRRPGGPVDPALPVVRFVRGDGTTAAVLVSYACHPVVLGADNLRLTADLPGVVRSVLSAELGGAPVLVLTGCAGDANTGHTAAASVSTAAVAGRSFAACARAGRRVAEAALGVAGAAAPPAGGRPEAVRAAHAEVPLELVLTDPATLAAEVARWEHAARDADAATAALLRCWAGWGRGVAGPGATAGWLAPVSVLRWADAVVVALPGEPFAVAALGLRAEVERRRPGATVVVAGYSNGCPGYLAAADEYPRGGYEIDEAHRYYGMPGPFAPGSLERVVAAAVRLLDEVL